MQKKHTGYFVPALCNFIGILMLLAVIGIILPLSIPRFLGYESYNVESGSMEPEIPVGSIVYVQDTSPQDIRSEEIIAFSKDETVITHRVRENRVVEGVFITKGDANPIEDIESVPYGALIGRVEYHIPMLGQVMMLITTDMGKVYLLLFAACGVMFNILAGRMRLHRKRQIREAQQQAKREAEQKAFEEEENARKKKKLSLEAQKLILETQLREAAEHERAADVWYDPSVQDAKSREDWYESLKKQGRVFEHEYRVSGKRTISQDIQALRFLENQYKLDGIQDLYEIAGLHALLELMEIQQFQELLKLDDSQGLRSYGASKDDKAGDGEAKVAAQTSKKHKHRARKVALVLLAIIFLSATAGAGMVLWQYQTSDTLYSKAATEYTSVVSTGSKRVELTAQNISSAIGRISAEKNAAIHEDEPESTTVESLPLDNVEIDAINKATEATEETEDSDVKYTPAETVDELLSDVDNYENVNQEGRIYTLFDDSQISDSFIKKLYVRTLDEELIREEKKYLRDHRIFAPVIVDFDSLIEVNPDVKGWIYCEDTIINYPVLYGETNDKYLRHTYEGDYNIAGSIFLEANNDPDLKDQNTIIYGHHMNDGSMFYALDHWQYQDYYESHPVMWLLTPKQDYLVVLIAGYTANAYSDTYTIFHESDEKFEAYLKDAVAKSDFTADVELPENGKYVLLSTCAYVFDGARYVVHGLLIPVDSAGGVPVW